MVISSPVSRLTSNRRPYTIQQNIKDHSNYKGARISLKPINFWRWPGDCESNMRRSRTLFTMEWYTSLSGIRPPCRFPGCSIFWKAQYNGISPPHNACNRYFCVKECTHLSRVSGGKASRLDGIPYKQRISLTQTLTNRSLFDSLAKVVQGLILASISGVMESLSVLLEDQFAFRL